MGYGISHIPFFFRHNDARVYEQKWDIPVYPKKILPHQEAAFFWYMGDEMEYPILKLPHRELHIFWDIELTLGYSGY